MFRLGEFGGGFFEWPASRGIFTLPSSNKKVSGRLDLGGRALPSWFTPLERTFAHEILDDLRRYFQGYPDSRDHGCHRQVRQGDDRSRRAADDRRRSEERR